jgi:hypothetical protein
MNDANRFDDAAASTRRVAVCAANCGVAIMAKASAPGRTKTRLVPPLTFDEAAALNTAFLQDIADNVLQAGRPQSPAMLRSRRAARRIFSTASCRRASV